MTSDRDVAPYDPSVSKISARAMAGFGQTGRKWGSRNRMIRSRNGFGWGLDWTLDMNVNSSASLQFVLSESFGINQEQKAGRSRERSDRVASGGEAPDGEAPGGEAPDGEAPDGEASDSGAAPGSRSDGPRVGRMPARREACGKDAVRAVRNGPASVRWGRYRWDLSRSEPLRRKPLGGEVPVAAEANMARRSPPLEPLDPRLFR